ncbi:YwmB family TATA-box binding protein [Cytobacillus spongiae]|uniref:YwmB family TATA-box binding protein n=1 Tax=Cytobacillus spongiae TaxID=2901381 RepID=UPI001F340376|nr:YwmB family TATA-box binding protein [Cytobacillus spongiae]UII55724.1 YwmB family TATA-box binding protein [Cytobacillus spongiae]
MKKFYTIFSILGILGFLLFHIGNKTTIAKSEQDLSKMATILEAEHILINGWSLHAREKLATVQSKEKLEDFVSGLKKKFSQWTWTSETSENDWMTTGTITSDGYKEEIKILSTDTTGQLQTYIIYEVEGSNWGEKEKQLVNQEVSDKFVDIFHGKPTIFSCIKGEFNDNMKSTLSNNVNQILDAFNATELEALKEDSFISTSANSPMFAESIKSNKHQEINLQIGLRTQGLGAKTTLVVGTPIITIEY